MQYQKEKKAMSDKKKQKDATEEVEVIDIDFDDGSSCTCEVIAKLTVSGITYAALLPDGDDDADILVYRYEESGDSVSLTEITDEGEFNEVADALDEILDDLEFNSED